MINCFPSFANSVIVFMGKEFTDRRCRCWAVEDDEERLDEDESFFLFDGGSMIVVVDDDVDVDADGEEADDIGGVSGANGDVIPSRSITDPSIFDFRVWTSCTSFLESSLSTRDEGDGGSISLASSLTMLSDLIVVVSLMLLLLFCVGLMYRSVCSFSMLTMLFKSSSLLLLLQLSLRLFGSEPCLIFFNASDVEDKLTTSPAVSVVVDIFVFLVGACSSSPSSSRI